MPIFDNAFAFLTPTLCHNSMGKRCDWFIASGAAQLRDSSPVTYEEYVCRIREANSDVLPVHFEDDWSQINLDVDRIGPSIGEFLQQKVCGMDQYHDDNDQVNMYANKIRDILAAYSVVCVLLLFISVYDPNQLCSAQFTCWIHSRTC